LSVVVVATITPLPEHVDAVRAAITDTVPQVHTEPGCELYALHEGDGVFVFVEKWTDADALAVHSRGAALAALGERLAGRVAGPAEVERLVAVPAGEPGKGAL
jgi:quinol monooxygenase YgiN